MKTKVTYVISLINKAVSFEWTAELMDKQKVELSFILLSHQNSELEKYLVTNGFDVKHINYKNKFDLPKALISSILFLLKKRPDAVHAHLFEGSLVGLSAAWLCAIKKRIYTRHHSSYHHDRELGAYYLARFNDPKSSTLRVPHETCVYVNSDGVEVIAQPNMEEPATYIEQVASQAVLNQLHLDVATKRPIWTSMVVGELDNIVASGGSISCPDYPHSAEDVALALNTINLDLSNLVASAESS